jgi:hypothetical protein
MAGTVPDLSTLDEWPLLCDGHAFLTSLCTEKTAGDVLIELLRKEMLPWRYWKAEQDVLQRGALADRLSLLENSMRWTWSMVALRRFFWSDPSNHSRLDVDFPNSLASRTGPAPIVMSGASYLEQALGKDDDDVWPRYVVDGASTIVKLWLIRVQRDRLVWGARWAGLLPPVPEPIKRSGLHQWVFDQMRRDRPKKGSRGYADQLLERYPFEPKPIKHTIETLISAVRKELGLPE